MNLGCCIKACGKFAQKRGLCHAHYMRAYLLVRDARTTWERLERAGKSRPVVPQSRQPYRRRALPKRSEEERT